MLGVQGQIGGSMKELLLVVLLCCLSGCADPDTLQKRQMDFVCKDKGGVYEYSNISYKVKCNNGSLNEWHGTIIPQEYLDER